MKILVFGDSIAWGAFDLEYGGRADRLKQYYLGCYEQLGVGIYNLSVSGNDSDGVLKFMRNDILKIKTIEEEDFIIIIAIGTNDPRRIGAQGNRQIEQEKFAKNIVDIIQLAKGHAIYTIIVGGFPINEEQVNPYCGVEYFYNRDLNEYDSIMESIAGANGVPFVSLRDIILGTDLFDGLHPNAVGHQKIYLLVKKIIDELIIEKKII